MPTYNIDVANPLDSSLVSAFPANERASRVAINSLLQVEHALTGRHKLPSGSRATRNALTDQLDGMWYVDRDSAELQIRLAGAWSFSRGLWSPGDVKLCAYVASSDNAWLPCNGTDYAIATYADLHAKIGSIYDTQGGVAAPGVGRFRVPNMKSIVPIGYHAGGDTDGDHGVIGEQVGVKKAPIDKDQIPLLDVVDTHRHTVHAAGAAASGAGPGTAIQGTENGSLTTSGSIVVGNATPDDFDKRQLGLVLFWMIKT